MILKRLIIRRLPGINERFDIDAEGAGLHIIFGPNGIGKSSICRAVEALYWADRGPERQTAVEGEFELDGAIWRAEREGNIVRWRRDGEEKRSSPNLPPSHHHNCFFLRLRDLLDTNPEGASDIASDIRRKMSGGFDLDGITKELFAEVTNHRKRQRQNKFNNAEGEVRKEVNLQSDLQQRVDKLEELESQLEKAKTAARRLPHVERASGLAERREELGAIKAQLGILPKALANLAGTEHDNILDNQKRLTKQEATDQELKRKLNDAREKAEESGLSDPLEPAELTTWKNKADELGRVEMDLKAARTECAGAQKELTAALKAVGGNLEDTPTLTLPDHAELFKFLREVQKHDSRLQTLNDEIELLKDVNPSNLNVEEELEKLQSANKALRTWLGARPPETAPGSVSQRPWLLSGLALVLVGTGLAWYIDPTLALLAALGAGIAVAAKFMGKPTTAGTNKSTSDHQSEARITFEKQGLEGPETWDNPSVTSRLEKMEIQTAKLQRAKVREADRKKVESKRKGLSEKEKTLDDRRQKLKEQLGLSTLPPDAELVDFARALDQLRSARGKHEAAKGEVEDLETKHAKLLADLAGFLKGHGEPQPEDVATAKAHLNNLEERNGKLKEALADIRSFSAQQEQNDIQSEKTRIAIRNIYGKVNLEDGDEQGLVALLERLPKYRDLTHAKDDLKREIDYVRTELEDAGEAELSERDASSLDKRREQLENAASKESGLRDKIAEVKNQQKQARSENKLQNLIAARENARANLQSLWEDALFAEAGKFLIEEVEKEYEQAQLPLVFERARDHFSRFTFHNYKLHLKKGEAQPRLAAIDQRSEKQRELDQLSDGTRAQLLLAARLAFTEEVEQGEVMPLFLDEALDQSDPERFQAIASNLGCLARDQGRQIFYLTSDPLDVERIRAALKEEGCDIASEIDLGRIRRDQASIKGPEDLRFVPAPPVPEPGELSPEEYADIIKAPKFRPARGFTEQHVFYLLWDDLPLLHNFLTNGIERVGQWQTVAGTPLAEKLNSSTIDAAQIDFRRDLLETFCELRQVGRGRPVDRDALVASKALRKTFLEKVITIAKELDGDPEQLLQTLTARKDDRLKGFRTKTTDELQQYLTEKGYLDDRDTLTEDELKLRARTTPAANQLPEGLANACLQRWCEWS